MTEQEFNTLSNNLRQLALTIPLNWGHIQNNRTDDKINMFQILSYEELEKSIARLNDDQKNYLRRRWFLWKCSACDEYLFYCNDNVEKNPDPRDKEYDVIINDRWKFDIKGTVIPKNMRDNADVVITNPERMIQFFYDGQEFVAHSCGQIVDRMELKIDSEDPLNVVGEIMVKGEANMLGYYKNPEATKAVIDEEGWLHTGDLGLVDKKGNIFIKGRNKNMILGPSGQNIYPEEIEDKLNSLDIVVESIVVDRDHKLVALIYPDYELEGKAELGGKSIEEKLREELVLINKQLPNYSQISGIEIVKEEFEKTPKRSIKRFMYK